MKDDLDVLIRIAPKDYHEVLRQAEETGYQRAQEEIARLRKALRFYADSGNWYKTTEGENFEICHSDQGAVELSSPDDEIIVGGRRARRALKGGE
jgi:hypothetical protein